MKFTGLPVCTLLGGRFGEDIELYRAISQQPPEQMTNDVLGYKAEGYTKFQLKLGGDPDEDIRRIKLIREALDPTDVLIGDANTGRIIVSVMSQDVNDTDSLLLSCTSYSLSFNGY